MTDNAGRFVSPVGYRGLRTGAVDTVAGVGAAEAATEVDGA